MKRFSRIVSYASAGLFSFFLFTGVALHAQTRVVFRISGVPPYTTAHDSLFIAGSFNNWNPSAPAYRFHWQSAPMPNSSVGEISERVLTLELKPGRYEFKLTRGSWDRVETTMDGSGVGNRSLQVFGDTTVDLVVAGWADHFPKKPRMSTAGKNVHIIDTAFYIPQLDRHRRVWIYLPASYGSSRKKYPVLYMHDGQNVFDALTSGFGEWGVDEALDSLGPRHKEIIVVAVDHGSEKRMNEYSPFDMQRFGKGEGDLYVDFLAKTLKPFIDRRYRTLRNEENTFVAGSSMGGLISFYAILKYPKTFGGAGVFSPSFWIAPQLKNIDPKKAKKVKGRIYFYAGQQESETMVPDMLAVFNQMLTHSKARMETVIRAEGKHSESTWRAEFPLFYQWLVSH
jgi:predicted alpha/beta superfamily hydrolase